MRMPRCTPTPGSVPTPTPGAAPTPDLAPTLTSVPTPASAPTPASTPTPNTYAPATLGAAEQTQIESATPLEDDGDRLDAFYDGKPLRYHQIDNILGVEAVLEAEPRVCVELHLTHAGKLSTHMEAKGDPAWREAVLLELESMERNRTWAVVDPPTGHCPISLKWVFKLKKDEKGAVIKHKARLLSQSFV